MNIIQQAANLNASSVALPAQPSNGNTLLIVLEHRTTMVDGGSNGVISGPNGVQVWTKIGHKFPAFPGGVGWTEQWELQGPFTDPVTNIVYSLGGRSAPRFDAVVMEVAP